MNVVANYYLTQRFPDVDFYFEPMCGDSGLSIGYAMSHYAMKRWSSRTIRNYIFTWRGL